MAEYVVHGRLQQDMLYHRKTNNAWTFYAEKKMCDDSLSRKKKTMELSDACDWFDDVEEARERIARSGGEDVHQTCDDSTEVEIEIAFSGGMEGFLRLLERRAQKDPENHVAQKRALILARLYDLPTVLQPHPDIEDDVYSMLAIVPKCRICASPVPSCMDVLGYNITCRHDQCLDEVEEKSHA